MDKADFQRCANNTYSIGRTSELPQVLFYLLPFQKPVIDKKPKWKFYTFTNDTKLNRLKGYLSVW